MSITSQYGKTTGSSSRRKKNLDDTLVVKGATIDLTVAGRKVTLPKAESVQIVAEKLQDANSEISALQTKVRNLENHIAKLTADMVKVVSIINRSRRQQ